MDTTTPDVASATAPDTYIATCWSCGRTPNEIDVPLFGSTAKLTRDFRPGAPALTDEQDALIAPYNTGDLAFDDWPEEVKQLSFHEQLAATADKVTNCSMCLSLDDNQYWLPTTTKRMIVVQREASIARATETHAVVVVGTEFAEQLPRGLDRLRTLAYYNETMPPGQSRAFVEAHYLMEREAALAYVKDQADEPSIRYLFSFK